VNTRPHAAQLYRALVTAADVNSCLHLSTLMCGAHRRGMLKIIRKRLKQGLSCRVVSTQLIEAGVDIDFPVVYRAAAGLDPIAQAAGRCNREGLLPAMGTTWIFDTEEALPRGFLEQSRQAGGEILSQPIYASDPLAAAAVEAYFRRLYWSKREDWDNYDVMPCFRLDRAVKGGRLLFQFRQAAEAYRMIKDTRSPILIPFEDVAKESLQFLRDEIVEYVSQRVLQPYLVSVRTPCEHRSLADAGRGDGRAAACGACR
jgi:CRISPR-associated endonuclease/helicase Cas3